MTHTPRAASKLLALAAAGTAGGLALWHYAQARNQQPHFRLRAQNEETALITGASSGIGAAFARRLAVERYNLILVARREDRLKEEAARIEHEQRVRAEVLAADLSTPEGIERVEQRIAECDTLSMLINNAGFGTMGSFAEVDLEKHLAMINVHMTTTTRLSWVALPGMMARQRGAIINVSSIAGFLSAGGSVNYSATKRYMITFSQALNNELEGTGVQVQALCPGYTYTSFHDTAEYEGFDRAQVPSRLWMSARDVVRASLNGLEQGIDTCIPGLQNQLLTALIQSPVLPLIRQVRSSMHYKKGE